MKKKRRKDWWDGYTPTGPREASAIMEMEASLKKKFLHVMAWDKGVESMSLYKAVLVDSYVEQGEAFRDSSTRPKDFTVWAVLPKSGVLVMLLWSWSGKCWVLSMFTEYEGSYYKAYKKLLAEEPVKRRR